MYIEDILSEIEEKRKILQDMLSKNDMNLKNTEVLKISKELDVLIAKYIHEVQERTLEKKIKKEVLHLLLIIISV